MLALSATSAVVLDRETGQFASLELATGQSTVRPIPWDGIQVALQKNAVIRDQLANTPPPPNTKVMPGHPTVVACAAANRSANTILAMLSPVSANLNATVLEFSPSGNAVNLKRLALPERANSPYKVPTKMALVRSQLALVYPDGFISYFAI
jgi:hypothetical protein